MFEDFASEKFEFKTICLISLVQFKFFICFKDHTVLSIPANNENSLLYFIGIKLLWTNTNAIVVDDDFSFSLEHSISVRAPSTNCILHLNGVLFITQPFTKF